MTPRAWLTTAIGALVEFRHPTAANHFPYVAGQRSGGTVEYGARPSPAGIACAPFSKAFTEGVVDDRRPRDEGRCPPGRRHGRFAVGYGSNRTHHHDTTGLSAQLELRRADRAAQFN